MFYLNRINSYDIDGGYNVNDDHAAVGNVDAFDPAFEPFDLLDLLDALPEADGAIRMFRITSYQVACPVILFSRGRGWNPHLGVGDCRNVQC